MTPKLRSACDRCHGSKIRCSGDIPCRGCSVSKSLCSYSISNPLGRPKGSKKNHNQRSLKGKIIRRKDEGFIREAVDLNSEASSNWGAMQRSYNRPPAVGRKKVGGNTSHNSQCLSFKESARLSHHNDGVLSFLKSDSLTAEQCLSLMSVASNNYENTSATTSPGNFHSNPFDGNYSEMDQCCGTSSRIFDHDRVNASATSLDLQSESELEANLSGRDFSFTNGPIHSVDSNTSSSLYEIGTETVCLSALSKDYNEIYENILDETPSKSVVPSQLPLHRNTNDTSPSETNIEDLGSVPTYTTLPSRLEPHSTPPKLCNCLEQQAEILVNPVLREMRSYDNPDDKIWSMDKALTLVKQAMKAWRDLLECPSCPYNDDQEVMILALISLRAVMRYLGLFPRRYIHSKQIYKADTGISASRFSTDESRLKIGHFEIEGDDRKVVLKALHENMLANVSNILSSLQTVQSKKSEHIAQKEDDQNSRKDAYQGLSDTLHMQQISSSLVACLQKWHCHKLVDQREENKEQRD